MGEGEGGLGAEEDEQNSAAQTGRRRLSAPKRKVSKEEKKEK